MESVNQTRMSVKDAIVESMGCMVGGGVGGGMMGGECIVG